MCEGLEYRLPYPPYGVVYESETSGFIIFLCRLEKSFDSFSNQLRQIKSLILILLCYNFHEVLIDGSQFVLGGLVSFTGTLNKGDFLFEGNHLIASDGSKIVLYCG